MNLPEFENRPGAIAIDLDGTLLNSRTAISERNRRAVLACIERGIPVIIATSRSERSVRRILGQELPDRCSLVSLSGAEARAAPPLTGSIIHPLPAEILGELVEQIYQADPGIWITVESAAMHLGCSVKIETAKLLKIFSATSELLLTFHEALKATPLKLFVTSLGQDLSGLAENLSAQFGREISVVTANRATSLSIVDIWASKTNAIRDLIASMNISLERVLAFGDDMPDYDMLAACGIPVAMENAFPQIKALTPYCTASNDEDGVAVVLERILDSCRP